MLRHPRGLPLDVTLQQARVLRFMREHRKRKGYWATVRDIQAELGHRSPSTSYEILKALERKGRVEKLQLTRATWVYVPTER